jgi:hypothetical protein
MLGIEVSPRPKCVVAEFRGLALSRARCLKIAPWRRNSARCAPTDSAQAAILTGEASSLRVAARAMTMQRRGRPAVAEESRAGGRRPYRFRHERNKTALTRGASERWIRQAGGRPRLIPTK